MAGEVQDERLAIMALNCAKMTENNEHRNAIMAKMTPSILRSDHTIRLSTIGSSCRMGFDYR